MPSSTTTTTPSFPPFTASAPGKIILSGEHAVVHGATAVASVIDRRTYVTVKPSPALTDQPPTLSLHIRHPQLDQHLQWPLSAIHAVRHHHITMLQHLNHDDTGVHSINTLKQANTPSSLHTLPHFDTPAIAVFLLYAVCLVDLSSASSSVTVEIESELPMGSGLGSSASYCASLATAMLNLQHILHPSASTSSTCKCSNQTSPAIENGINGHTNGDSTAAHRSSHNIITTSSIHLCSHTLTHLNWWSLEGEKLIHGNPSGVDNTCAVFGGMIVYQRGADFQMLSDVPSVRILISNTGVEKDTKKLVAGVGQLHATYPTVTQPIFQSIDAISQTIITMIKQHQLQSTPPPNTDIVNQLSTLFRLNQHLLNALGVGHPAINHIVQTTATHTPSLSSKLTGAGGGGCVLTLLPPMMSHSEVSEVRQVLIDRCQVKDCFESVIGQGGVRIEKEVRVFGGGGTKLVV